MASGSREEEVEVFIRSVNEGGDVVETGSFGKEEGEVEEATGDGK